MDRRRFLQGLSLSAVAVRATAQPLRKPLKLGVISAGGTNADVAGPEPVSFSVRSLVKGLGDLGYRYGIDYALEGRGGQGRPDRYGALAAELVAANVDVIVAAGPTVNAVRRVTTAISIVMVGGAADPVGDKLVASLAKPDGNVTGLTLQQADLAGKRVELLKQVVPGPAPIGALWEGTSAGAWRATQAAAAAQGWKLLPRGIANAAAIAPACASVKAAGATSLLVVSGGILFENVPLVVEAAAAQRLPAVYALRIYAEQGGLMSYAADLNDLWRRAATFVDRIARRGAPAAMPMEQPTKFELVINLRTARALDIAMPPALLLRADDTIQ